MENFMDSIKRTLIVGASSDIGSSLLNIYLQNGHECIGTYNKTRPNNNISCKYKKLIKCDLSKINDIEKLIKFSKEYKALNILYLPGLIDQKSLLNNDIESIHESFNANIFAYWLLISNTIDYMKDNKYGRFLSISSIGSKFGGGENRFNYTTSKKLLEFFPRDFKNLAQHNIFINNIICGVTDTQILRKKKDETIQKRVQLIPIKRLARPEEIALCAFNLCSEINTFQTLSNTTLAGGE